MKLSTKGRYGIMAVLDLSLHDSQGQVSLKSIAERQNLSENYLEQLFAKLRKADIVKSVRGAQGGYNLARKPEEITIGAILRALEGSLAPVDCVMELDPYHCDRAESCVTKVVWEKMRDCVNHVVDSISLKDLMEDYCLRLESDDYMFHI